MNRSKYPDLKEIRLKCQPAGLDVCFWRRLYARRLSAYLTWIFIRLGISANAVSLLKGFIACFGSLLFAPGVPMLAISGAVLLQLSFVLDASDGEVARYHGTCSTGGGEFLDKIGDVLSRSLFHVAWGFALFRMFNSPCDLAAGAVVSGCWLAVRFCSVETLLESFANHPDLPPGESERDALRKLFVRTPSSGKVEYLLSLLFHPWMNLAVLAAALSFLPDIFRGLFWGYNLFWLLNTIRKIRRGFLVTDFRRRER